MTDYGQSEEAVKKATGKSWDEWLKILDDAGADKWPHKDIADWLWDQKLIASGWWCQSVTVGYERARGLRDVYQNKDGYSASASKTFPIPVEQLYEWVFDPTKRSQWCMHDYEITSATKPKAINGKFADGSRIAIGFYAKGDNKSQIALEHRKLKTAKDSEREKQAWKEHLSNLSNVIS